MHSVDVETNTGRCGSSTMAPSAAAGTLDLVPEILPESDTSTFTIPDRLTIQGIAKRRAASGRLIAGVAAPADLEVFKVCHLCD